MMSSTLGAPLGGTIVGGHHGLESLVSLIVPPNFGGGGGRALAVVGSLNAGEPGFDPCAFAPDGDRNQEHHQPHDEQEHNG